MRWKMVLFVALFLQLNWLQVVHAGSLDHNPLNSLSVVKEYDRSLPAIPAVSPVPTRRRRPKLRRRSTRSGSTCA